MALKITAHKNHLPTSTKPFVFRSGSSDIIEYREFLDIMAKGRTTLTKPDIAGVMELYSEELLKQLADGKTVKLNEGSYYVCASGCLNSLEESFRPDLDGGHQLRIHFRPDRAFETQLFKEIRISREEERDGSAPSIRTTLDADLGTMNSVLLGGVLKICGLRLRFAKENPLEGLFLIDTSGTETRCLRYFELRPSAVLAEVPNTLVAGPYTLALRSLEFGAHIREGRYEGLVIASN